MNRKFLLLIKIIGWRDRVIIIMSVLHNILYSIRMYIIVINLKVELLPLGTISNSSWICVFSVSIHVRWTCISLARSEKVRSYTKVGDEITKSMVHTYLGEWNWAERVVWYLDQLWTMAVHTCVEIQTKTSESKTYNVFKLNPFHCICNKKCFENKWEFLLRFWFVSIIKPHTKRARLLQTWNKSLLNKNIESI